VAKSSKGDSTESSNKGRNKASRSTKTAKLKKSSARSTRSKTEPSRVQVMRGDEKFEFSSSLPVLPLRDVVIFPYMTMPLLVGRPASVRAIERAVAGDRVVFVLSQKNSDVSDPKPEDLYKAGTAVRVLQLFRLPDGTLRVLVEGLARARVTKLEWLGDSFLAKLDFMTESFDLTSESEALVRAVFMAFEEYVRLNRRIPDEVLGTASNITDPSTLGHAVAAQMLLKVQEKQELLETESAAHRLVLLRKNLANELEILKLERKIEGEVRTQVHKNQREFYLHEQMKAIRKELGQQSDFSSEIDELAEAIRKARMPKEVRVKARKELDRLSKMSFMSPEATVVRNYVDWLANLPWKKFTRDQTDLKEVSRVLDEDHYGLRKVKDRILEYIAVLQLTKAIKGPILCFVGPPGVGKTSLGRSIARALGRKFLRVSLGGVHDEAEIRGHRRTYIGSLPGRILQSLKRVGSRNPVFVLDEVDKLGSDFRGDPASALLEVLDPEQNHSFTDHYLEVEFDLSRVMFICTANQLHTIPPALRDRMELIRLPGYLENEKLEIANRFLLPRQLEAAGLSTEDLHLGKPAVKELIRSYTREAGVRNLERELAAVCRKTARKKAAGELKKTLRVGSEGLSRLLGPPRYTESPIEKKRRVGVATGLAWTDTGGEVLTIEVSILPGRGELILTGKLGDVMRESGRAAMSYARSRATRLGLDRWFYKDIDVHIHVPEGAMPKDGPSAGITMAVALISALTEVPTRDDVAMTGEITLRGNVLPIGGLSEKVVAARRVGVTTVVLPKASEKDLLELPPEVRKGLKFVPVETMDEVLELALASEVSQDSARRDEGGTLYAH
jgi:ATP-dependent Lon protease